MNFVDMFEQFSIKRKRLTDSDYKRGHHSGLYSIEARILTINIDSVFIIKGTALCRQFKFVGVPSYRWMVASTARKAIKYIVDTFI